MSKIIGYYLVMHAKGQNGHVLLDDNGETVMFSTRVDAERAGDLARRFRPECWIAIEFATESECVFHANNPPHYNSAHCTCGAS